MNFAQPHSMYYFLQKFKENFTKIILYLLNSEFFFNEKRECKLRSKSAFFYPQTMALLAINKMLKYYYVHWGCDEKIIFSFITQV